jgi:iron(III) transport system ATP-binding protein
MSQAVELMTPTVAAEGLTGLVVADVHKFFGSNHVLRGVDLAVERGTITAVLGPSGCGKTTLLRVIAGFLRADGGRGTLEGRVLFDGSRSLPPERRHIGIVPQEGALFPHLSVEQNVAFGVPRGPDRRAKVAAWLDVVGLHAMTAARPHELSGGQQQRVALARALAAEPALVLLDEPFSSLDAALRVQVREDIGRILRETNSTAIIVTHDRHEALSLADRVAVMFDGAIQETAPPQQLYQAPSSLRVATFVGDAVLLDGEAVDGIAITVLGRNRLARPVDDGLVTIVVRPEQFVVHPHGVSGLVVERRYYGADSLLRVLLDAGPVIVARAPGATILDVETRTGVRISGDVIAFPRDSPAP